MWTFKCNLAGNLTEKVGFKPWKVIGTFDFENYAK
jgi:hypothetical protein